MIFDTAPFPHIMFKSALKESQWRDVCGPYSQINSFRKGNVIICVLKFCTLSEALILSGSSFQRRGEQAQNSLSPSLFRLVCGIRYTFVVFDLRVLVLACLTIRSLRYRGAHPCVHLKVKSRILNSVLFLMASQ